ncbi:MAG: DNA alkylation repair protein [Candidatus Zophobacter franzmannii]|nr:DNA alkylation repair protein [Candidatus Zophobacter franzmannii]
MEASDVRKTLLKVANRRRIESLAKFFQVFPGGYGYGDAFIGITYTLQKPIVATFAKLPLKEVEILLQESIHEYRSGALQIMVKRFKPKRSTEKKEIIDLYLKK